MLLLNTYLDLNPLTPLSSFSNRNVIYEDIPAINSKAPSYHLIGHKFYLNLRDHQKILIEDFESCKAYFLNVCWKKKFACVDCADLLVPNRYDYEVHNEITIEKIKAFIGLLQFTK